MNWKPISEAPKDGTVIDLFHKAGFRVCDVWWDGDDIGWSCCMDDESFTHFCEISYPE